MNVARQILTYAFLLLIFGFAVPEWKGLGFLDPALLGAYACMGMVFAGPAAAQAFEKAPGSVGDGLRRIGLAVAFGEGITVALLGCGLATLYITHSKMLVFPPDLTGLVLPLAMGLGLSLAVASMAGWVAVQYSASSAKVALRAVFIGLLLAFFLRGNWLPQVLGQGTVITLAVACVFLGLLMQRLRRT
ncbi:MAG TPA: hypothetical protein VGN17_08705 [Bryobacteraceae bacterium]|jgi:hypothetical protein